MSLQAMRAVLDAQIPEINSTRRLVLLELANYASPSGTGIRPSLTTIGERAVISRNTVRACLTWAEQANIIKCTKPGRGRGRVNVWAMNLALLDLWKAAPKSDDGEDAPDFGPLPDRVEDVDGADKRVNDCPFYETEKGQPLRKKGQWLRKKGQPLPPILLEPVLTLDAQGCAREARRASVRPEGRSLGDVVSGSSRGKARTEAKALLAELAVPVNKPAWDAWAALVAAIVARREQEAARSWLSRRSGVEVEVAGAIIVANQFKAEKLRQALGGLLDEVGWQVTVRGSG